MSAAHAEPSQVVKRKTARTRSDLERQPAQPEVSFTFVPRIPPGEYLAFSRSASIYWDGQFRRWVCAVQFDVMDDSLTMVVARLTWYLNLGSKDKIRVGRRSKYWGAWTRANGGQPKRQDRLSPRVFAGRYARVVVEDTKKNHRSMRISEEDAYSVIRDVVRWETGATSR
jgi:hypothetical protein